MDLAEARRCLPATLDPPRASLAGRRWRGLIGLSKAILQCQRVMQHDSRARMADQPSAGQLG